MKFSLGIVNSRLDLKLLGLKFPLTKETLRPLDDSEPTNAFREGKGDVSFSDTDIDMFLFLYTLEIMKNKARNFTAIICRPCIKLNCKQEVEVWSFHAPIPISSKAKQKKIPNQMKIDSSYLVNVFSFASNALCLKQIRVREVPISFVAPEREKHQIKSGIRIIHLPSGKSSKRIPLLLKPNSSLLGF